MSRFERIALVTLIAFAGAATPAFAAEITSVTAPTRVKAGGAVKVVASVVDVPNCSLAAGQAATTIAAGGADRVTFTFSVNRKAKAARYTLTLRCLGAPARRLRVTVTGGGTSRKLVTSTIRTSLHAAPAPQDPIDPGNTFRAVYALAADQTVTPRFAAGIVAAIKAVNGWFATQTFGGVQPRWLLDASGAPQVRVVTLPRTKADYSSEGGPSRLRDDLLAIAPLAAPGQKSVVWADVDYPGVDACGFTSKGITWIYSSCFESVTPTAWPNHGTTLVAHELTHNFGAAFDCSAHSPDKSHVLDDPRDILYTGDEENDDEWVLDAAHDDYYGSGPACGDIATSPFWTRTSDPRS